MDFTMLLMTSKTHVMKFCLLWHELAAGKNRCTGKPKTDKLAGKCIRT